jgi:hypothetical protein
LIACNQQLEKYKRTHAELCDNVLESRHSKANPCHLGKWMTEQCFNTQKAVLEKERVAQLNANGNTTAMNDFFRDDLFRELLAYLQKQHGDYNVPQGYPRNPLLARWASEQRNDCDLQRRGEQTSLTPLRKATLDAIGFTWFAQVLLKTPSAEVKAKSEASPDHITSG